MTSHFATLLVRFLEVYRRSPDDLFGLLQQEFDVKNLDALRTGDKASLIAAEARILDRGVAIDKLAAEIRSEFPDFNSVSPNYERFRRDEYRLLLENWARDHDLNSTEDAFSHFVEFMKQSDLDSAEAPDLHVYFGLQFAASVDRIVDRTTGLEELEYGDILSDGARELLKQAHHCYLHGLDAAVAILCGAALEETLKDVLKKDRKLKWNFKELLREAEDEGLLESEEWAMGDDVLEHRNDAVHDPSKFSRKPTHVVATILSSTRAVIKMLLVPKQRD